MTISDKIFGAGVLGGLVGGLVGFAVTFATSEEFEERRCVALESALESHGHTINLAYSSKGCVLAEDL